MKILLSPAKSLDFTSELPTKQYSLPKFLSDAVYLNSVLKKKTIDEIRELMGLSQKLAVCNWERNQDFSVPFSVNKERPAIYTFNGDVYAGFDANTLGINKIALMQDQICIISGLYGILKPLDLIAPYRLEMSTKIQVNNQIPNLYTFWKEKLTAYLKAELHLGEIIVNLASNAYAKAIDSKTFDSSWITPIFKEKKGSTFKIISFYAKKARGLMARYCIETQAENIEDIQQFELEGYQYSPVHTVCPSMPVFIR